MTITYYVLVFAALCINISLQYTPFLTCSEGSPAPIQVRYADCTQFPCRFKKNSWYSTHDIISTVDFIAATDSQDLVIQAEAKVYGSYKTLAIKERNCPFIKNRRCPLKAGDDVEFTYKFNIPFYTPKADAFIRISIYNEKKEQQTCFEMVVSIV